MPHIQVRQGETPEALQILIDGQDWSHHVYADGFGVVQVGEGEAAVWGVSMVVAADSLDIDLPNGAVLIERSEEVGEDA